MYVRGCTFQLHLPICIWHPTMLMRTKNTVCLKKLNPKGNLYYLKKEETMHSFIDFFQKQFAILKCKEYSRITVASGKFDKKSKHRPFQKMYKLM